MNQLTKEQLIAFEEDIAKDFNDKKIRAPIHLYSGNEDEMIRIFSSIRQQDWVLCSWRSHFQCLLKGVPQDVLKQRILDGKSISLCFPEYKIFSSAIVTGVLPIAVGLGLSIQYSGKDEIVYVFVGDMTSETGIMWESLKFVIGHNLPVRFIIEDNGKSVQTDTRKTWKTDTLTFEYPLPASAQKFVHYYRYTTKWPHAGANKRIQF